MHHKKRKISKLQCKWKIPEKHKKRDIEGGSCKKITKNDYGLSSLLCRAGIIFRWHSFSKDKIYIEWPKLAFTSFFVGHHTRILQVYTCDNDVKATYSVHSRKDEQSVPDVKLTKSRDGTIGMATFSFDHPFVFDSSRELGDIYKYSLCSQ
jgi:hypothetical protein